MIQFSKYIKIIIVSSILILILGFVVKSLNHTRGDKTLICYNEVQKLDGPFDIIKNNESISNNTKQLIINKKICHKAPRNLELKETIEIDLKKKNKRQGRI